MIIKEKSEMLTLENKAALKHQKLRILRAILIPPQTLIKLTQTNELN